MKSSKSGKPIVPSLMKAAKNAIAAGKYSDAKTSLDIIVRLPKLDVPATILTEAHERIIQIAAEDLSLYAYKAIVLSHTFAKMQHSQFADILFYRYAAAHCVETENLPRIEKAIEYADLLIQQNNLDFRAAGYELICMLEKMRENYQAMIHYTEKFLKFYLSNRKALKKNARTVAKTVFNMAAVYDGTEEIQDPLQALKYYKIAGHMGIAESHNNMGEKYRTGEDVSFNINKAITHFKRAYELGYKEALINLLNTLIENQRSYAEIKEIIAIADRAPA